MTDTLGCIETNHLRIETSDFDLHGIVGIRLVDATSGDIAAIQKQLGPIQKPLTRAPDIVIRFVDRLAVSSRIRYLGVDDAGFTDDAFLVFRGKHKRRVRVQIPFDQIGSQQCQIVCESGAGAVPLLIAILNLTALSKGALPLHASALRYNDKGILVTGWAKGGKTETLLAFVANGAEYIGDEWVYVSSDGQRMYGIPEPTRVWYWHLQQMPHYKAMVKRGDLTRLRALNAAADLIERLDASPLGRGSALYRLKTLLKQQLNVQLPPEKLFGRKPGEGTVKPEKIFLVASHAEPNLVVERIDPQDVAKRMVFSLQEERIGFMSYYLKYRFAFPDCPNPLIERAEDIQRSLLLKLFADKDAYAVYHPYPFSIPALFEVIRPYCA
jgi:hypothetical protein